MSISFGTADKMSLEHLQAANVKRCTANDILAFNTTTPDGRADLDSFIAVLDAYFSQFAKPSEGKCIACGRTLGGLAGALVGGFQYGMAWGEGACGCGYPGRALHVPKDMAGEKLFEQPLQCILLYHPSVLRREKECAEEATT